MTLVDVVIFRRHGVLAQGTLEWPDAVNLSPTRVEVDTKAVIRRYEGGQVCLQLLDGRLIWLSDVYLEDYVKLLQD